MAQHNQDTEAKIPLIKLPTEKPIKEQLKDATDSLAFARQFIVGLEKLLSDIFPGWEKYDDDELPAVIQAFHLKYNQIEYRGAAAEKALVEMREALEDRTQRWSHERARVSQRHGEAMAKIATEMESWKTQSESLFKRIEYLRTTLEDNSIEYEGK